MTFDNILSGARKNANQIQKIATKLNLALPAKFPQQIEQLNDCLDTYSASKVLIATVVNDVTTLNSLNGWNDFLTHFNSNWDNFAKEYNEIFNKANAKQQKNILEIFTREHFGDNIFEAGSVLKKETPQILSGIIEFKNAIELFGGSYRNPVEAAYKIKNGINAIVKSTEKIARSTDKILKIIRDKRGIPPTQKDNPLSILGNLSSNQGVAKILSSLNVGAYGISLFSDGTNTLNALKHGDFKSALSSGQNAYKTVKNIISEIKKIANKSNDGTGSNPLGSSATKSTKSSSKTQNNAESSGPAYSYICSKAKIKCSNGDKISNLTVLPSRTIWLYGQPQANISDHLSMVNIAPCGKCHTTAYPPTGSATAANHGTLTPMPCIPNTPYPWMGGKNDVLLNGDPALISTSKLKCIYGGTITITFDGQMV